jgi:hypothetical protein
VKVTGVRRSGVVAFGLAAAALPASAARASDPPPQEFDDNPALVCPDGSPGENCDAEAMRNAVVFGADYATAIDARCLYRTKAPCRPIAHGRIVGARYGPPLIWQHMVLSPSDGPLTQMLVIAQGDRGEDPYVLVAHQTDGWFAPPMLVENGTEGMLVHAPGRRSGSGSGRADIVLSRHSQGWTTFSIPDLLAEAEGLMVQGFSLASGANVDLTEMILTVPVSRAGDGACCPTGGMALIDLDMPEGNMIRVSRVTFIESQPVANRLFKGTDGKAVLPE